LILLKDKTRVF